MRSGVEGAHIHARQSGPDQQIFIHKPKQYIADIYEDFHARWVAADPPNILAFPPIFGDLKAAARRRLRAARGDLSLLAFWP